MEGSAQKISRDEYKELGELKARQGAFHGAPLKIPEIGNF
jgi:hypothetical protein